MDEIVDDLFIKHLPHRYECHYNISPSKKNPPEKPKREKYITTIHHRGNMILDLNNFQNNQNNNNNFQNNHQKILGKSKRRGVNKQIKIRAKLLIDDLLVNTPDWAICSVCNEVFKQPVVTPECGHTYCLQCIEEVCTNSKSRECPLCLKAFPIDLNVKELSPNLQLVHVIDTLKVRCRWGMKITESGQWIHDPDGCPEITEWQNLFAHDEVCGFVPVACPFKSCSLFIQRRNFEYHQSICEERQISCDLCSVTYPFKNITEHKLLCPQYQSPCPKGCGQLIANQNRKSHLKNDCPEIEVHCVYQELGCQYKDKKRIVDEHINACIYHTLKPFILQTQRTITDLVKDQLKQLETIKEQQKEINELRQLMDQQEQEIKQLKAKQQTISTEHQISIAIPSDNTKSIVGGFWKSLYRFIDPRDIKISDK